jgi:amino acid adenylation domain-containing protein
MGARWLHEIFERSAARFPDLIALTVPESGESLSYAELDAKANHFASHLRHHLSGSNEVVAVHLRQDSADIVALHLAILKAGATQVFIDPDSPSHVYQQILADAAPTVLITESQLASLTDAPFAMTSMTIRSLESLKVTDSRAVSSQSRPSSQAGSPSHPSACQDSPSQRIAALFYTSGTTGTPKGVECAHAGYINLVQSYATYYDFVPGSDATSLTSSLGYDGSISELYSAWVAGCEVVLLTKAALRSGPELLPILRDHSVTALFCPPVLLSTLTARPEIDLPYPICRYIVPAGEAFPASLVEPWSRARRQIVNTYGPTEVSTDTSRQLLRPNEPVTIGSPFAGVSYFILDPATLELLPHGTEGELCIGGCQLAHGYRNRPEATATQFFTHPQFGRLYRSGDRCHVDPLTLRVHFHGRLDAQLKVRGFRVEAQPIESLLQDHFAEFETAVLDCQNNELIAFIRAPSLWGQTQANANVQLLEQPLLAEAQALVRGKIPSLCGTQPGVSDRPIRPPRRIGQDRSARVTTGCRRLQAQPTREAGAQPTTQ